ncbi:DedA family protein [Stackebrandtia nassauensis]|uniref:SNARE associated Golgi protein-like protein n=1 Tax=Stackebrandtia nassauensis (strain DSM 44728 / CIP 108903 / NRRL B-16338 / NBRC 102104 / LLR-40K-21) TaxID=446470 RepID=D3Q3I7_STANL|nr:DedA family protein [Stackebrandtia nassauensis]ADD42028.1 SNARE associated Golgi protein-like protein [Stackebrandtia nassauensis DSM 44728]
MANAEGVLDGITDWAVGLMETLGAPGAGLAVALENLFPPLPSEIILPLAGFTASKGDMNLIAAVVWTTIGSLVGALALYLVGAGIGRERLLRIAARLPLVKVSDIEKTEAWFHRHGTKAIFFGRMIPIFRSLISIPAGVERMPILPFLVYTTLGSLIWNSAFIAAGYLLGENWSVVETYVGVYSRGVVAVVGLAFVVWLVLRIRTNRRQRREPQLSMVEPGVYRSDRR